MPTTFNYLQFFTFIFNFCLYMNLKEIMQSNVDKYKKKTKVDKNFVREGKSQRYK